MPAIFPSVISGGVFEKGVVRAGVFPGSGSGEAMVMRVKTDNVGTTNDDQYRLNIIDGPADVFWGDGTSDLSITGANVHTYPAAGVYDIEIKSTNLMQVRNALFGDLEKLIDIRQMGSIKWNSMQGAFYGCTKLVISATDAPDLSNVTTMINAFRNCTSLPGFPPNWDMSGVQIFDSAWENTPNMLTGFESYDLTSATTLKNAWRQFDDRVGILDWGCTTSTSLTDISGAWERCNLTQCGGGTGIFPFFEMSNVTNADSAWLITGISNVDENLDWSSVQTAIATFFGCGFICFLDTTGPFPDFDYASLIDGSNMFDRCGNICFGGSFPKFPVLEDGTEMFNFSSRIDRGLASIYDEWLNWHEANNSKDNVPMYSGLNANWSTDGEAARDALIVRGWIFTDGELVVPGYSSAYSDGYRKYS